MQLVAACPNCRHFEENVCALGVALPSGELRCDQYVMTPAFKESVISAVLQDGGIEMKMKLATRARLAADKGRPLKGFRAKKRHK